jgi:hypothetical protein
MTTAIRKTKVGDLRPSQLLYSFGVGALLDLPSLSALVMGLDDWETAYATEIGEDRLLAAVRSQLGPSVKRLLAPPLPPETEGGPPQPFDPAAVVGVPVTPFPQWMYCPYCRLLAPLHSGLFELRPNRYHADRTRYVHVNCTKPGNPTPVLPSRFLVACTQGHLDDFPWSFFVHEGHSECKSVLRLNEPPTPGEATNVFVQCDTCGKRRPIARAFGREGSFRLPVCRGRRPHLRDVEGGGCREPLRAILLGASNTWFPVTLSAFAIPTATGKLQQLVESAWTVLEKAVSIEVLRAFRSINQLPSLAAYSDEEIWAASEAHRLGQDEVTAETVSLRAPEWAVLSQPDPTRNGADFRLAPVEPPLGYRALIDQAVLAERLREVRALVGFTRIESPGDLADVEDFPRDRVAPLTRKQPQWVPAYDVRGEGIFLRFNEEAIEAWEVGRAVREWEAVLRMAHREWRQMRFLDPLTGFPGMRYVLLHSFSHALMRQLVLECGYTAASLSERIYARPVDVEDGPMAGVLIYTAAPDSEGTLGGLVGLGKPEMLGRHVRDALEGMRLCASDPLCAEHQPVHQGTTLHGAACHGCLFLPETSCERGNKYLDRSLLIDTLAASGRAFFPGQ